MYNLCRKDVIIPMRYHEEDEVNCLHEDLLVVTSRVRTCDVCHILVDTWSSIDLLYLFMLHTLGVYEEDVKKKKMTLVGFNNNMSYALGTIKLSVMAKGTVVMENFVVIDTHAHYNLIL